MKKLLATCLAMALGTGVLMAGDNQRFELVLGDAAVDGEGANGATINSGADAYAARFMQDFGDSGYFSGGINLERVELSDVNGGAWNVDAMARAQKAAGKVKFYLAGALGGIFTDVEEVPVPVEIAVDAETTATGELMDEAQNVGLRATGLVGAQFFFSEAQRVGFGIEYAYSKPLGDGFLADEDRGARVFLILPATGGE